MSRTLQFVLFFVIVLGVVGGLHYYFWVRLVRATALAAPWRGIATGAIIGLGLFLPTAMILSRQVPPQYAAWFAYPAYVWMGGAFLLFVLLLGTDLVRLGAWILAHLTGQVTPSDPERRLFIARAVGAASGLAAVGLTGVAVREAVGGPRIEKVEIPIAKLPAGADGLKIVQLTDVHVGPTIGRPFIEELVARVNALQPDIVAITGDLVDGSVADLGDAVAPLAQLRARHGVYFVTGNHEYYSGVGEWLPYLRSLGIRVLENERVSIGEGADAFDLAGVNDYSARGHGHAPDLERALAGRDPERALVLLAHQPRQVRAAARAGVDLQLSGHTHGGQIWPFSYLVFLQQPYVAGLERLAKTWIYVSKGTGYWGPPMRLAVPSEITEVVLRRQA